MALSTAFRFALAIRDPAPWIFQDEIAYSEFAKSLAFTGGPGLRGVAGTAGFGIVYPLLIAPAYLLFDAVPDAYTALRFVNSLLMSLTAVPVYLLARRVSCRGFSLAAATLAVAIPSLGYTGTVMTENAFYPICAVWLLLLVLALERPTILRQFAVLAVLAVAFFTRAQAVTFVGILGLAILLSVIVEGRAAPAPFVRAAWRRIVAFWPTALGVAAAGVLAVIAQVAQGETLSAALGAYAGVTEFEYDWREVLDWLLWHLGEIDIVVGVLPFAALLLLTGFVADRPQDHDPRLRAFLSAGVSFVVVFSVVVAAFASHPVALRIEERNYFHVVPVFFVAFAAWLHRGAPRPVPAVAWALIPAIVLPARIPFERFLNDVATHSTMGLLPVWRLQVRFLDIGNVPEAVFLVALIGAALFALTPRRFVWILPLCLLLYYAGTARMIENFTHQASVGAAYAGARKTPRDWVDRAVGRNADVASLWWGGSVLPFWEHDFFNRSVGRAYTIPGVYDGLPMTQVEPRKPDGLLRDTEGRTVRAEYVLTDQDSLIAGTPVAEDPGAGMTLYKVGGPLRVKQRVDGLYPDRWAGGSVHYVRHDCRPGTLVVRVNTEPELRQGRPVTIDAVSKGGERGSVVLRPGQWSGRLLVPLRPRQGICDIDFTISPIASALHLGAGDTRELGARFESFVATCGPPGGS